MDYQDYPNLHYNLQPAFTEDGCWIGVAYQTTADPTKICIDSPLTQYSGKFNELEMRTRGIKIPKV